MAKENKQQALQQREDPAAPFLFDEDDLPQKAEWVQVVEERPYEHTSTGARLLDDEEKVQRMVDLLCLGNGIKRVARALGVSPHTVRAARNVLVAQGKVAPFKERFVQRAEELIEDIVENLHEAIENGRLHPNFMSSALGIMFDKRALALGEPTVISVGATTKLQTEALSVKALNDWIQNLPVEGESSGNVAESRLVAPEQSVDAGSDTGGPAAAELRRMATEVEVEGSAESGRECSIKCSTTGENV
jgi:transposase-like protein